MTTTRVLVASVTLLIAAQVSSAVESSSPGVDSQPEAVRPPPVAQVAGRLRPPLVMAPEPTRPTILTPPDSQQTEPTATDPMDADSGVRFSHRQILNLGGAFAFSAGFVAGLLFAMIVKATRVLGRLLGTMLTRLESPQDLPHRNHGQTHMLEGGGASSAKDNG